MLAATIAHSSRFASPPSRFHTTSKENPNRAFAASAVKVGLKKINGNWLISSSDPV
ncbi:MAG TPA: hypothetical protein VFK56_07350 [Mycobacterium sp.]|nr:hypothetical protein [Mycobacterium sp.]